MKRKIFKELRISKNRFISSMLKIIKIDRLPIKTQSQVYDQANPTLETHPSHSSMKSSP